MERGQKLPTNRRKKDLLLPPLSRYYIYNLGEEERIAWRTEKERNEEGKEDRGRRRRRRDSS